MQHQFFVLLSGERRGYCKTYKRFSSIMNYVVIILMKNAINAVQKVHTKYLAHLQKFRR